MIYKRTHTFYSKLKNIYLKNQTKKISRRKKNDSLQVDYINPTLHYDECNSTVTISVKSNQVAGWLVI